ncbi:hypothetical protein [Salinithrix halophila]|uniref:Uncharacterized protein n=1 Tax=Salinithrix halophila TaxID=1485204 RepID=A0ABV8JDY5_9BACL
MRMWRSLYGIVSQNGTLSNQPNIPVVPRPGQQMNPPMNQKSVGGITVTGNNNNIVSKQQNTMILCNQRVRRNPKSSEG